MRLLIAEDDRALGTFLARGLEQDGHEIIWRPMGKMAMEGRQKMTFPRWPSRSESSAGAMARRFF